MAVGLLGRKVGVTQVYDEGGAVIPVTVLQVGPCHVLQIRTQDRDGYEAVQLGFLDKPRRRATRSERGHVAKLDSKRARQRTQAGEEIPAKADCEPKRFVREIRGEVGDAEVGGELTVEVFEGVDRVDVTATCKGRGFAGAMSRSAIAMPVAQGARLRRVACSRDAACRGSTGRPRRRFAISGSSVRTAKTICWCFVVRCLVPMVDL